MKAISPGLLIRTLRHLRAGQLAAQVGVRLNPSWRDPSWVARRRPPDPPAIRWRPVIDWLLPDPQTNAAVDLAAGRFTFVNDTRQIGWPPDWSVADAPLLWRYNLHYLEWAWALSRDEAVSAAADWSQRHVPVRDAVGWSPYPTSLRLPSLCLLAASSGKTHGELWESIWRQAEHLSRRLEYHLLGNHLLENAIALAFVGSCFDGPDSRRWHATGLRLLRDQIAEQILPDGMHFERSPMYQTRLTYALALLVNTGNAEVAAVASQPLARMMAALAAVCHPDGQIALFNDSAFGIYHDPGKVVAYAAAVLGSAPVGRPSALPHAGYYRGDNGRGDAVICDAGLLGPDYVPGHSHGDIFSFELSFGGRRVVVDSGTYDYVASDMRRYCRSTAAHNTVTIDGEDQAEFWAAFRVGRRGRPHDVIHREQADGFTLEGWHDGYRHLPAAAIHRRRFVWNDAGTLGIRDAIDARRPVHAASRLHLHPDCHVLEVTGASVRAACGDVPFTVAFSGGGAVRLEEGWYCPRFGVRQRNTVIVHDATGSDIRFDCLIARGDTPGAAHGG